ncbi:hypothetical protein D0T56_13410 [Dysgonomonas sp. 520]|nr:hypothetical protein [Dysgonomonas sp. 520]
MTEVTGEEKNTPESMKALIEAFTEAARKKLEYDVEKYRQKRANGNILMMDYYKRKLYKAILALRDFESKVGK